jgi:PAS domain S-box-containing protein
MINDAAQRFHSPGLFDANSNSVPRVLWNDGERIFYRVERPADNDLPSVLVVSPAQEHPAPATLDRLAHEYGLKDELDRAWAVRPLDLIRESGRTMLVLEDPGGERLEHLLDGPMETGRFLHLAIGITQVLGELHQSGFIHKDLKPANILLNRTTDEIRFTGFGLASRLRRERLTIQPPETIAGTLAYMPPEQTGWMNRSLDSRSDLYALGVILYQMLTGSLPFTAADPMEWVHCHIARQPTAPAERVTEIPEVLSAIVMKLLAKTAEDRYQTAGGLVRDLRRCLDEFKDRGLIEAFPLGQRDASDRLTIPEKLYGREREIETLLASFDRIVDGGTPELVLVSGYSGIGKSSVVNELHKVLVPPRALFASGKFDQYKRDIPYATLAQALRGLIQTLLSKSDAELAGWRDAFKDALGDNGQLIVDLVPELSLIIGDQAPVPELNSKDAQHRFQRVFRRFLGVFAQPEHPLALFLDDLQWLDAATLDLIEDLLTQPELSHLMLIGAYRENEVDASHPLVRKLEVIRQTGARVEQIPLGPLGHEHLRELITDTLRCEPSLALPLANLVQDKTAGNPFFAIQFLNTLADEGLLTSDIDAGRWSWDIERLRAKGYTDNVVTLMVGRLVRRPEKTRQALQQLACLGAAADISTLAIVLETSPDQVHLVLSDALSQELVERRGDAYHFIHDRVQEATYSMIPVASRAGAHLRIGRLLIEHTPPKQREEAIFEIVGQLNRGTALIISREEREQVAELNLLAGKRAKTSTAYSSALSYFKAGTDVLGEKAWESRQELAFELEQHRADCELWLGAFLSAEERLADLAPRVVNMLQRASVATRRVDLYSMLGKIDLMVEVGLEYLRHAGIDWVAHPKEAEARREYDRIWSNLGDREIEDLIDLPRMHDSERLATLDFLATFGTPTLKVDENLYTLVICRGGSLSLEHGNSDASPFFFSTIGLTACYLFGDYAVGYRLGKLACDLIEERGLGRSAAKTYEAFALLTPWTRPVRESFEAAQRAFQMANAHGDSAFAAYALTTLTSRRLTMGEQLDHVDREAEYGLEFSRKIGFENAGNNILSNLALVRMFRGETAKFGSLDQSGFSEQAFEARITRLPATISTECVYWIRKLQARFFAGDYTAAIDAAAKAERGGVTSWQIKIHPLELATYHLYNALSRAASCSPTQPDTFAIHETALRAHLKQLRVWGAGCPANFEHAAALVGAEIARIEGRVLDAESLYEQAIRSARTNRFVHNEALAYELAARFYASRGFEQFARTYLTSARDGYLRWGAFGKVRQLDELHPWLGEDKPAINRTNTIRTPVEHLHLATVVKVSQAVSGEIVPEKLVGTLLRTALEQAGAERGLLVLSRGGEARVAAEATTSAAEIFVQLRNEAVDKELLPESILQYVLRTRESVIVEDATTESTFATDPYIQRQHSRSILCLPLLNQAKLIGALFLENRLAAGVFAPARIAVLKLVSSQAAIALENSRLYSDLQEREAKIRRLVDANIIGILFIDVRGGIMEANDAFLSMVGYDREDVVSGRIRWTELTPPEWRDGDAQRIEEVRLTGTARAYEKELFRKDGSRVPVLVGAASFEATGNTGVAFVLDLTERKRAEEALRELESDFAHMNRVSTMGELAASLSHEILHPIATARNNARAAIRFLDMNPPNLGEVREALNAVVRDMDRGRDIVVRMRDHIKKAPPRKERFGVNDAVNEVIALLRSAIARNRIAVSTDLMAGLSPIRGDRVQLQQVLVNLILNAIEAMSLVDDRPRELTIRTTQHEADGILLAVHDSGPGIDGGDLERVFEPFYSTKTSGIGMGLSICRSIIRAHGGRLWVSPNEPKGAVFQFTLPLQQGS